MISFLLRKIWKRRWLMLCLLMGNILLVGTVSATFMYNTATMTRILRREIQAVQAETSQYPVHVSFLFTFNSVEEEARMRGYTTNRDIWLPRVLDEVDIPVYKTIRTDTTARIPIVPVTPRDTTTRTRSVQVMSVNNMADLVTLSYGRLPSPYLVDGNTVELIATEGALFNLDLLVGERLHASDIYADDPDRDLFFEVVGIYRTAEGAELTWSTLGVNHNITLFMDDNIVHQYLIPNYIADYRLTARWIHVLDHMEMSATRIEHYEETLLYWTIERFHGTILQNLTPILARFNEQANQLSITLLVLQLPMFVMLALFIYMVSRQILILEQNEISVVKSRGASRGQILGLYIMQGLFIALVSLPLGLLLGIGICGALGSANGFMELVQRAPLQIEFTPDVFIFSGLALLFSFLAMILPVIRFSKVTIVTHKLTKSGKPRKPLWQLYFLDILCLGAAIYVNRNFAQFADQMTEIATTERAFDPLLLLGSSMFIIGAGLLCLRLFPYIVQGIFFLGRRFWSPSVYASFLKVIRSAGEEQFIMIFLVFTLAVGIFSAQSARTLNLNYEHEIRYLVGTDIVFAERWMDNSLLDPATEQRVLPAGMTHIYNEPSMDRFAHFDEVVALTRVIRRSKPSGSGAGGHQVTMMAIETNSFGETVWFRDDLLRAHLNHYLNALALRSDGVLLSANFRDLGLEVGSEFRMDQSHPLRPSTRATFTVVGFVEHWPGFSNTIMRRVTAGLYTPEEQFLAVVNKGFVNQTWGVLPYQVWMNTQGIGSGFFTDFVNETRLPLATMQSTSARLFEMRTSPMVQGTNGVLTINFLITLLICFSGFLIYWILSIRSRILQFGIFRAMGMTMGGIIRLLVNEQVFITMTALGIGAAVGELAARNFVPIIQLSYSAALRPIPLLIVVELQDYINLYTVMGTMIVLCLAILFVLVSRMRVAQVLKLGED